MIIKYYFKQLPFIRHQALYVEEQVNLTRNCEPITIHRKATRKESSEMIKNCWHMWNQNNKLDKA